MIKVLLVDDQTLVRQGIRGLLELSDDIRVVGEADDGSQVLNLLTQLEVDVILLDLQMPNVDGVQVLAMLQQHRITMPTLILTSFDDYRFEECAQLGARGYLLKDVSLELLVSSIKKVHSGERLLQIPQRQIPQEALKNLAPDANPTSALVELTPREREVLRLMASGCSNKEIALQLQLSAGTVKNHVSNILAKMGVRDRTRAVLNAINSNLLSD